MKFRKIYTLLLTSFLFVACSEEESWNSSDVTVNMAQEEVLVKESAGIFNVPVTVSGELNGPIKVTVEVTEAGENPAMEDVHYIVTSKSIVIPADATGGNIEICAVDDNDINETRTFTVKIVNVEGASVGNQTVTTVGLRDNDSAFYEKLQGKWKMSVNSPYTGAQTWDVTVIGYDETEDGYNEILYVTGMMGYDWTQATLLYNFDMNTQKVTLSFALGTMFAEGVNFGADGLNDVYLGTAEGNQMVIEGTIDGECNDDFTTITFDNSKLLYFFLAPSGTGQLSGSLWDAAGEIVMKKN